MIFFTSDLHFYHKNIIKFCQRPFSDIKNMNEEMIERWNERVRVGDEVYILGDFSLKADSKSVSELLNRLNGKKYLIHGNHDKYIYDDAFNKDCYEWVKEYYVLEYRGLKFVLFHYPIIEWEDCEKGSILLYGHVHKQDELISVLYENKRAMNVGVDFNHFQPISIEEVIEKLILD